jgi:hypothetical protein
MCTFRWDFCTNALSHTLHAAHAVRWRGPGSYVPFVSVQHHVLAHHAPRHQAPSTLRTYVALGPAARLPVHGCHVLRHVGLLREGASPAARRRPRPCCSWAACRRGAGAPASHAGSAASAPRTSEHTRRKGRPAWAPGPATGRAGRGDL